MNVMYKLRLIYFVVLIGKVGFAQSKIIDSLSTPLSVLKDDKTKILFLSDAAYHYRLIKPDSAIIVGQNALNWAKKINYPQGISSALNAIGSTYRMVGDLQNAMLYCYESINIAQKNDLRKELGIAHMIIGNVYSDLKEYDLAIEKIKTAISILKKLDNTEAYATAVANLGDTYYQNNQPDSALIYLQMAENLIVEETNNLLMGFTNARLAATHLKLKNYEKTYSYLVKSIEINKTRNITRGLSLNYQTIAQYYNSLHKIDSAIYYATQGFEIALTHGYKMDMLYFSNLLSEYYGQEKDTNKAYRYAIVYKSLNDSIYGVNKVNALQKKIIEGQVVAREVEAKNLADKNRLKQNALLIILGVMTLSAYFLYRIIHQKQKANQDLEKTLSTLKSTQAQLIQSEKMASLGELTAGIAHEIQNPLNFVNNFSSINNELINEAQDELAISSNELALGNIQSAKDKMLEASELLQDVKINSEKINQHGNRASSIVKGMLEHSRKSSGVKEPTDINKLCDEFVRLSYHGLRAKDKNFNCDFKLDLDPDLPLVNVVSQDIGRVLLNIINNAFQATDNRAGLSAIPPKDQHGLSDIQNDYKPLVSINTNYIASPHRHVSLRVSDNGPGIPDSIKDKIFQPFFTTRPTGQGTGLGLSLAYDIVKAHGGEIKLNTNENKGSEFIIILPI